MCGGLADVVTIAAVAIKVKVKSIADALHFFAVKIGSLYDGASSSERTNHAFQTTNKQTNPVLRK
jgi:alpha/beta superfamily hydrolase